MYKFLSVVFVLIIETNAFAFDPFVNLVYLKEKEIHQRKTESERKLKIVKQLESQELRLFTPVIRKPFNELSIQGVISSSVGYRLVLVDPSTGETFLLKPGDAISENEKLVRITPKAIVIAQFKRKGFKVVKSYRRIRIDSGGQ